MDFSRHLCACHSPFGRGPRKALPMKTAENIDQFGSMGPDNNTRDTPLVPLSALNVLGAQGLADITAVFG